jgi:hypothetical protein
MILKFSVALVEESRTAQASVSTTLTAGDVARMLRLGGLEIATPLAMGDRVGGCGLGPGDRLGIFTSAAAAGDFPAPLRTGGREITVRAGGTEISSAGRPTLTIGVPDPADTPVPDVDLREAARSSRVNLLPARCAALLFDGRVGQWFAALTGGARVMIDDYELTQQPIPISASHTLRFYSPIDDPATDTALAELRVVVAGARTPDTPLLPSGPLLLTMRFATEIGPYTLRASDNVRIGQVAAGLAKQAVLELHESAHVARLRVAAPHIRISDLLPGEQFYVST